MDTDQLVQKLASEGPQKPLLHPMWQTMLWLLGMLFYFGIFGSFSGLRSDIGEKLANIDYLLELFLLIGTGISSAMAAFCLSRPDAYQRPWIKYVAFGFLAPLIFVAFVGTGTQIDLTVLFQSMSSDYLNCPLHIFMFSTPPAITLFLIIKMGATIQCYWAGSMATLSVTAFAYMLMRLIEQNDNPIHLLVWHVVPVMFMCMTGMIVGQIALKWRPVRNNTP